LQKGRLHRILVESSLLNDYNLQVIRVIGYVDSDYLLDLELGAVKNDEKFWVF
jgi:dUTPase